MKLFDKWDMDTEIRDEGLKDYINLDPVTVPRQSQGRHTSKQLYKSRINIIERFINHLFGPGHKGKKHKISSGRCAGKSIKAYNMVKNIFNNIEKKQNKNPVEVFIKAVENASLREEIISFRLGSVIARKAVISSPQRRVDLALRYIVQGSYNKVKKKGIEMEKALEEEITAAYNNSKESFAIQEKNRIEMEAEGAR